MRETHPRRLLRLAVVLGAVGLLGCSAARETRSDPFVGAGSTERLTIAVLNENTVEVRLRLLADGTQRELGSLIPQEVEVFEVPWSGVEQLRIEVAEVAGDRYRTPFVSVRAGARVDVVVRRNIRRTRIFVR